MNRRTSPVAHAMRPMDEPTQLGPIGTLERHRDPKIAPIRSAWDSFGALCAGRALPRMRSELRAQR